MKSVGRGEEASRPLPQKLVNRRVRAVTDAPCVTLGIPADAPPPPREFQTTHWSLVLEADGTDASAHAALESLCRDYWYPLCAFVRRRGTDPHRAQDLTQEFFARLIASDSLRTAQPERGRFRTLLLAAMKNFLANDWRDSQRLKRGGGVEFLAWDSLELERRYALEPADGETPESLFERRWAHAVVATALESLATEMASDGTVDRFAALKRFLQGGEAPGAYAAAGAHLGLS